MPQNLFLDSKLKLKGERHERREGGTGRGQGPPPNDKKKKKFLGKKKNYG
jgi:hypothetical protein